MGPQLKPFGAQEFVDVDPGDVRRTRRLVARWVGAGAVPHPVPSGPEGAGACEPHGGDRPPAPQPEGEYPRAPIRVHVVRVGEPDPPAGAAPVEWLLRTSEELTDLSRLRQTSAR